MNALFKIVDGVDDNTKGTSFVDDGSAGAVYHPLLGARRPPPDGAATAQAALDRATAHGGNYAKSESPTSPLANLSGNDQPGVTHVGGADVIRSGYPVEQIVPIGPSFGPLVVDPLAGPIDTVGASTPAWVSASPTNWLHL